MSAELLHIEENLFSDTSVLIIGAGWMAEQYATALECLGIKNITAVTRTIQSAEKFEQKSGIRVKSGGYEKWLEQLPAFDLIIVATPIGELCPAAIKALACGNKKILVEKPGSLYPDELKKAKKVADELSADVRIAYNRLCYPNYIKLKELISNEGGILSCRYTFTELIRSIDFEKEKQDVYHRWGIANSSHVISTAHDMIGLPENWQCNQAGSLEWHPSGAQFVGSGITEKKIPFSYHADWASAGRWGIEVMTPENAYRLVPMEKLFRCKKGTFEWEEIRFEKTFPNVKQGIAEEVYAMLTETIAGKYSVMDLENAIKITKLAEKIFGYDTSMSL